MPNVHVRNLYVHKYFLFMNIFHFCQVTLFLLFLL